MIILRNVIQELKDQGTTPDMVQIGNEINHGIVWPEGNVSNLDSLAQLINAGTAAVKAVDPSIDHDAACGVGRTK